MLTPPTPGFEALPPQHQGRQLAWLVRDALDRYGIVPRALRKVREGFCTSFRVTADSGSVYALKVGRIGTETINTLRSEAEWAAHLARAGLPVARLLPTADGDNVAVGTAPLAGTRPCVLYEWLPGKRRRAHTTPAAARALGQLLAGVHDAAASFTPSPTFERKTWAVRQMCGRWRGPDPIDALDADLGRLVAAWHRRIAAACRPLPREPTMWGPILADVGPHNVLWLEHHPWLFDFNDTGWGLYAYDLAILWRCLAEGGGPAAEEALLDGYTSRRRLPAGWGPPMQAAALIRALRWRAGRRGEQVWRRLCELPNGGPGTSTR